MFLVGSLGVVVSMIFVVIHLCYRAYSLKLALLGLTRLSAGRSGRAA
jgi:hypothetical protein